MFQTFEPVSDVRGAVRVEDARQERLAGQHRRRRVHREVDVVADQRAAERRVVVAVAGDHVRLDQREVGQRPGGGVALELGERHEVRRQPVLQPRVVDDAVERERHRLHHVDLPRLAVLLEPLEDRLRVVLR